MNLVFEYLFYVGLLLFLTGGIWLMASVFRRNRTRVALPITVLAIGLVTMAAPAILTRYVLAVDLGPRETIVAGETHITLTGWNGDSYEFLAVKSDTVVLQMANADVNDETLTLLKEMDQLRELDLNDSSVTDRGLTTLAKLPSLKSLRIRGTAVSDEGFREHLLPLKNLMNLDVRQTSITADTIEQWQSMGENRRALFD